MLIDTHFHLDLMENMQSLISEFRKVDVRIIAVGTTPKANKKEKQFCSGVENIKVAAGLHPQLITERKHEIDQLLELVKESRFVGEIGLDFNSGYIASKEQQLSCFRKIIKACADEGNKVLSIHSVKAVGVAIDELKVAGAFQNNICIFHWFTGTAAERKKAIEAGAWFSINPRMLTAMWKALTVILRALRPKASFTQTLCSDASLLMRNRNGHLMSRIC